MKSFCCRVHFILRVRGVSGASYFILVLSASPMCFRRFLFRSFILQGESDVFPALHLIYWFTASPMCFRRFLFHSPLLQGEFEVFPTLCAEQYLSRARATDGSRFVTSTATWLKAQAGRLCPHPGFNQAQRLRVYLYIYIYMIIFFYFLLMFLCFAHRTKAKPIV